MKNFCFTVDDNIIFLKELTRGSYGSIFEHPYLAMYLRLHQKYDLKIQLNLFYEDGEFALCEMTDRFACEWRDCSDWLKLSFHSRLENERPYLQSGYDEVFEDCAAVHREILRFASKESLARTTTVHYCRTTHEGLAALAAGGVCGLLGLYGNAEKPRGSYQSTPEECELLRSGATVHSGGIAYGAIDVIMNAHSREKILEKLDALMGREHINVMIHEQYFYPDYPRYQSDFEQKISAAFERLSDGGYMSVFFEDII